MAYIAERGNTIRGRERGRDMERLRANTCKWLAPPHVLRASRMRAVHRPFQIAVVLGRIEHHHVGEHENVVLLCEHFQQLGPKCLGPELRVGLDGPINAPGLGIGSIDMFCELAQGLRHGCRAELVYRDALALRVRRCAGWWRLKVHVILFVGEHNFFPQSRHVGERRCDGFHKDCRLHMF